jgi:Zn-dependent protease
MSQLPRHERLRSKRAIGRRRPGVRAGRGIRYKCRDDRQGRINAPMSDAPREPLEPELLPRPGERLPEGPSFFPRDDERYFPPPRPSRRPKRWLPLVLFILTILSTFFAGSTQFTAAQRLMNPQTGQVVVRIDVTQTIVNGLTYSLGVMAILVFHEMGHYLQARRYGVPASLPFFIPMPIGPFGPMGAVIVQQAGTADRKSMFDIAISGPLAGLVLALPMAWWGIRNSQIMAAPPGAMVQVFPDPLILKWIVRYYFGELGPNQDVQVNPLLFAGWVGIFITGLNLIPIGQLDGGHILYCLLRRRAHAVARWLFLGAAAIVATNSFFGDQRYTGWWLMLALLWMFGTRHPPTADDRMPLGRGRILLGWLTLAFIFIGFSPRPPYEAQTRPIPHRPPIERNVEKEIRV